MIPIAAMLYILFFMTLPVVLASCKALTRAIESATGRVAERQSRPRRGRLPNPDAGRWLGAPVAELDKSTLGQLLTSRCHRDPGLVVTTAPSSRADDIARPNDALWDRELDG